MILYVDQPLEGGVTHTLPVDYADILCLALGRECGLVFTDRLARHIDMADYYFISFKERQLYRMVEAWVSCVRGLGYIPNSARSYLIYKGDGIIVASLIV